MEQRNDAVAVRPWHAIPADALALELRRHSEAGLGADEAGRRQQSEGFNELPEAPPPSLVKLFFSQFSSVIVWVLIGAPDISGLIEDWIDAAAILAIVLLNGVLGFVQEFRAERSLAALRKLSVATARAVRNGIVLDNTPRIFWTTPACSSIIPKWRVISSRAYSPLDRSPSRNSPRRFGKRSPGAKLGRFSRIYERA